jgi:alkylation response protein AidB-like acyl-CoA dehydrogenase
VELGFSAADEAFRAELRAWLDANLPDEVRRNDTWLQGSGGDEDGIPEWARRWQATLFDAGWLMPDWPRELGGRDATPQQTLVYFEELARVRAPRTMNFQGLSIVAPSLRDYGSPEQVERWLVPTLRGDVLWCIGMSEPGAGSDLGALSTKAELVGDEFVVNGQKVWTSSAHFADLCFVYVRTDPAAAKHAGISVLVVDMRDTPGVVVRPFKHLTGKADFAEVFFTDAHVPRDNLIGDLHGGWRITMGSLAHERGGLWVQGISHLESTYEQLVGLARKLGRTDDPVVRDKLAWAYEQVASLRALGYQGFASFARSEGAPEHSLLKLAQAELAKSLNEMGTLLLGPMAAVVDPDAGVDGGQWPIHYFAMFAGTIAGGTSEIQRNIIAERILGLPRG